MSEPESAVTITSAPQKKQVTEEGRLTRAGQLPQAQGRWLDMVVREGHPVLGKSELIHLSYYDG